MQCCQGSHRNSLEKVCEPTAQPGDCEAQVGPAVGSAGAQGDSGIHGAAAREVPDPPVHPRAYMLPLVFLFPTVQILAAVNFKVAFGACSFLGALQHCSQQTSGRYQAPARHGAHQRAEPSQKPPGEITLQEGVQLPIRLPSKFSHCLCCQQASAPGPMRFNSLAGCRRGDHGDGNCRDAGSALAQVSQTVKSSSLKIFKTQLDGVLDNFI